MRADESTHFTIRQVSAASSTIKAYNEDTFGHTSRSAWMIDGATGSATSIPEYASAAQWFAETLSTQMARNTLHPDEPLAIGLERSINTATRLAIEHLGIDEETQRLPVAAIAAVKAVGNTLEVCAVGDCAALIGDDTLRHTLHDNRSALLERPLAQAISAFVRAGKGDWRDARKAYASEFAANRAQCNISYAAAGPGFRMDMARQTSMPLTVEFCRVILASDGAYGLVDVFDAETPDTFFLGAVTEGAGATVEKAIRLASTDPALTKYPRTKPFDDSSVLVVEFHAS